MKIVHVSEMEKVAVEIKSLYRLCLKDYISGAELLAVISINY